jgi:outer membrane receptor for ferrienterochelin and colicins
MWRRFDGPVLRGIELTAELVALSLLPGLVQAADSASDTQGGLNEIVVTSMRTESLIGDEPLRVEAVPAEEIEENLTVQPGNLSSLLNELPSVRVQSAAPGLGGAGLQLRGMPVRDTLVLSDGLPLLGAEPDAFGLLQTPPLDLKRVEVIKGAASALYGGSALGGVLNLVSQTADAEPTVLANVSSVGTRDLEGFFTAKGSSNWTGTLIAGAHDQSREDLSGEGWADIPGFRRYTLRPRIWVDTGEPQSLFATLGFTDEYRDGGTMPGRVLPDGSPFAEELHTRRLDGGAVSQWLMQDGMALNGRLSITATDLDRTFGAQRIASAQTTAYVEEALDGKTSGHAWVVGIAYEHDALVAAAAPGVGYSYNVPAVFAQDEYSPTRWLRIAGSARVDAQNDYGTFFSPRVSALLRKPDSNWSLRASLGGGFAAPTPFVDEIESTGLGSLLPLRGLHAERADTESLDAKWTSGGWDLNASVFDSQIHDLLQAQPVAPEKLELVNSVGPWRAPGAEFLMRFVTGPLQLIGSWSYIGATEVTSAGVRQQAPLVPRESGELGFILESEKRGRIGLEGSFTGRQAIDYDPFRTVSEPYFEINALGEIRIGGVSIFVNAINLTDVRQTRFDPLVRPTAGPGGDPITDVWAPLDGRSFNLGIRTEL